MLAFASSVFVVIRAKIVERNRVSILPFWRILVWSLRRKTCRSTRWRKNCAELGCVSAQAERRRRTRTPTTKDSTCNTSTRFRWSLVNATGETRSSRCWRCDRYCEDRPRRERTWCEDCSLTAFLCLSLLYQRLSPESYECGGGYLLSDPARILVGLAWVSLVIQHKPLRCLKFLLGTFWEPVRIWRMGRPTYLCEWERWLALTGNGME